MSKLVWMLMSGMLAVAVLAMCVPCAAIADDDNEEAVAIKDLPKAVVDAVMKACPGCTLVSAEKETEDDGIEYEIKVKLKCGKVVEVEVEVAKDGTIKKVEIEDDDDNHDDDDDDKK